MKKNELSATKPRGKKRKIAAGVSIFALNFVLMCGLIVLAIFLNGIGFNKSEVDFTAYFNTSGGQFIYLLIVLLLVLLVTFAYLLFEDKDLLYSPSNVQMIFLIIEVTLVCSYISGRYVNIYFRPLSLAALLTLLLVNRRTAIFINTTVTLIIFMVDVFTNVNFTGSANAQYSALIIGFTSGIFGVYLIDGVGARIKVFARGILIAVPKLICLVLLEQTELIEHYERLIAGISAAVLSVVLFMAILPVFEVMFKKVTNYRLTELTDHSSPLVKKLIEEAPGTFNHSLVVSNLAESCAIAIGENALLARCAAYYHDMGKLRQPEFFKENQQEGKNPHDDITPELSVNIIKSHAKDGYDLLKKYRLPQEICDVCLEHHGTLPIMYFYAKAKKFADGGEVSIEKYSYAGPKPTTKIAAIIMIADASEAIARTLKDRTRENVDKSVEKVINDRMYLRQFDDCDITLKDLNVIRNTVVNNLTGVYHKRVAYPKINLEDFKGEEGM